MNLFLPNGKQIFGIGEYLLKLLQSLADAITIFITTNYQCDASSLDALLHLLKLCGCKLHALRANAADKLFGLLLALLVTALNCSRRCSASASCTCTQVAGGDLDLPALPAFAKLSFAVAPPPTDFALGISWGARAGDAELAARLLWSWSSKAMIRTSSTPCTRTSWSSSKIDHSIDLIDLIHPITIHFTRTIIIEYCIVYSYILFKLIIHTELSSHYFFSTFIDILTS